MCVCVCVCVYVWLTENKFVSMKMYRDEKPQGYQRKILFTDLFANVKRFECHTFIR